MSDKDDDRLDRALRDMSRQPAAAGFTGRVLGRLAAQDRTDAVPARAPGFLRGGGARSALLVAATMIVVLLGLSGIRRFSHSGATDDETAARADVEALRREYRRLAADLDELASLDTAPAPVIYVGSSRDVDLVLDLRTLQPASTPAPPSR